MVRTFPLGFFGAHPFSPHAGSWWSLEPTITLGVLLLTGLYLYAVGPLRKRYHLADRVERSQVVYFLLAMLTLFVSLQGPMHELSDYYSLTAHMIQHLLVTLIMPPLLLKGIPPWLIDPVLRVRAVLPVARLLTHPFVAFALFNAIFSLWHVPAFYQAALGRPAVHGMEHMLFMATAVLTWWPVYSPSRQLPPLSDPLQMLYLFAQSLIPTVLGALIVFAKFVMYPFYAAAPRVIPLSPIDDQQVAGLIMWLGGGSFVLLVLTIRFFRWMEDDDESVGVARTPVKDPA
ncbi:MAG: cytochrome c oxidase assembly protein [Chloroflexota bacterium]|nr:cytochrome c oxidase assembly protein [Chloroflexota bacterium]PLS79445.1 MAG: cytochrome c oxidase assembly protein [Chloroflexota bacterium]